MCEYFALAPQLVGEIIATVGWPMMVTGQSLVLYSRLGVVLGPNHDRIFKAVKWMIIVDAIVFHVSTTVVMFGTYNAHPAHKFALAYEYIEKIQMTAFTTQEFIVSGIFCWCTLAIFKSEDNIGGQSQKRRRVMVELFGINAVIIILDIALLVVEYQNRHVLEQAVKAVVYSIKLKLEFAVLSKLVTISQRQAQLSGDTFATLNDNDWAKGTTSDRTFSGSTTFTVPKQAIRDDICFVE